MRQFHLWIFLSALMINCTTIKEDPLRYKVYQTSASGDKLKELSQTQKTDSVDLVIKVDTAVYFQNMLGFGGAFTESTAHLFSQLGDENQRRILSAYFAEEGAGYSLCRTHMNSCDFSLDHYSYAPIDGDSLLDSFSIDHDRNVIIPMIQRAQSISANGFKIIASPWTAPPWMKDNYDWNGGRLLRAYYPTWAKFFARYHQAYADEGIDIWGFTVENEPLGNDANWESMHFTPEETADFVKNHLGPTLSAEGVDAQILVYDQNRGEELEQWARILLNDEEVLKYIYGTAVHWYTSTVDWMGESLQFTHRQAPDKAIIHTEGCVDAEVPHWKEDAWYWSKEATDWGWDWAKPEDKKAHPKYVPVYRYARDIIGCMNNWVEGWIDWNMVLDRKGGPNLAQNWCTAPVIVDPEADEIYFTPLYYTMTHFSKFIKPGAKVLATQLDHQGVMAATVQNTDGSFTMVLLNMNDTPRSVKIELGSRKGYNVIDANAIQTIVIARL